MSKFKLSYNLIAIICTIFFGICSIFFYLDTKFQNIKDLEIKLVSNTLMINPELKKDQENLKLFFNNEEIDNLSIMQLQVINTGKQPIKSSDFDKPIKIYLKNIEKIVSSKIIESNPKNLEFELIENPYYIEIENGLLNSGDNFIIEIKSIPKSNSKPDVHKISGRIVNIKEIIYTKSLVAPENKSNLLDIENSMKKSTYFSFIFSIMITLYLIYTYIVYERPLKQTAIEITNQICELKKISEEEQRKIFRELIMKKYGKKDKSLLEELDQWFQHSSYKIGLDELVSDSKGNKEKSKL